MFGTFKKAILTAAAAGALLAGAGVTPASAVPLTLNPQAPNQIGACVGNGLSCQISTAVADVAFPATQASFWFTSDLIVQSLVNAPGAAIGAREVGSLLFDRFGASSHGLQTNYNIYGTFEIAGTGHWGSGAQSGTFILDAPGFFTASLFANPTGSTDPTFAQATQAANGVTAPGTSDFLLATMTVNGYNGAPTATFTGGTSIATSNSVAIDAALALTPAAFTSGPTGFWQNVLANFVLNVGASASGNNNGGTGNLEQFSFGNGVNGCTNDGTKGVGAAGCVDLRTHGNFGPAFGGSDPASFGNGTFTFDVVGVPEPATLGMFGFGLLGLGLASRRRKQKAA